jgi:hypothetical protein
MGNLAGSDPVAGGDVSLVSVDIVALSAHLGGYVSL